MKRFLTFLLCLALSFIWISQSVSARVILPSYDATSISLNPELSFGNEPLVFPKDSQLRRVFSESNIDQNYLREIRPEDNEITQIERLMGNLFESSDTIFYQALIPTESGYHQAFLITAQMPKDNFIKSQWGALFPNPEPDTLLGIYQSEFQNKLLQSDGKPVIFSIGSQERISLLRFTKPTQMGTRNHSLIASHSVSFVVEFDKFSIPVYYRQWGWTNDDQYYLVFLVSLDGERDFWEQYAAEHFFLPFVTM